jgi:hypothetical protein
MLAGIVEKILMTYFGDFLEDFQKDQISLGVNFIFFLL